MTEEIHIPYIGLNEFCKLAICSVPMTHAALLWSRPGAVWFYTQPLDHCVSLSATTHTTYGLSTHTQTHTPTYMAYMRARALTDMLCVTLFQTNSSDLAMVNSQKMHHHQIHISCIGCICNFAHGASLSCAICSAIQALFAQSLFAQQLNYFNVCALHSAHFAHYDGKHTRASAAALWESTRLLKAMWPWMWFWCCRLMDYWVSVWCQSCWFEMESVEAQSERCRGWEQFKASRSLSHQWLPCGAKIRAVGITTALTGTFHKWFFDLWGPTVIHPEGDKTKNNHIFVCSGKELSFQVSSISTTTTTLVTLPITWVTWAVHVPIEVGSKWVTDWGWSV